MPQELPWLLGFILAAYDMEIYWVKVHRSGKCEGSKKCCEARRVLDESSRRTRSPRGSSSIRAGRLSSVVWHRTLNVEGNFTSRIVHYTSTTHFHSGLSCTRLDSVLPNCFMHVSSLILCPLPCLAPRDPVRDRKKYSVRISSISGSCIISDTKR